MISQTRKAENQADRARHLSCQSACHQKSTGSFNKHLLSYYYIPGAADSKIRKLWCPSLEDLTVSDDSPGDRGGRRGHVSPEGASKAKVQILCSQEHSLRTHLFCLCFKILFYIEF